MQESRFLAGMLGGRGWNRRPACAVRVREMARTAVCVGAPVLRVLDGGLAVDDDATAFVFAVVPFLLRFLVRTMM